MRLKLLLSLLLSIPLANAQLYPVTESTIDASWIDEKFFAEKVPEFSISELITVKEFNAYLAAVKKDSSAEFYNAQLPKSRNITEDLVKKLLVDPNLQDKPMPGVSWTVARNYCTWLNASLQKNHATYTYDLPFLSELIAYQNLYQKLDDAELESWTLTEYCENCFEWPGALQHQGDPKKEDPPALKRKVHFGGSYQFSGDGNRGERKLLYEYQDSSSRYIGFRIVARYKNIEEKTLSQEKLNIAFGMTANHLNGIYEERYPNGKLKVLGTFEHGQRKGMWSAWSEYGDLQVQRNYSSSKEFDFHYPQVNNPYKDLYSSFPDYVFVRNKEQFFPYLYVEERSVIFSQRAWRTLSASNEPMLFKNVDFKSVVEKFLAADAKWFKYGACADFKSTLSKDSIAIIKEEMKSWDYNRIEVKEDFFVNVDNILGDTRIIALSFYKNTTDTEPSYTVYYPHTRSILAGIPLTSWPDARVKNVDDLFFFHLFRGELKKISNLYDRNVKKEEDLKIEIGKFISEHQLWLDLGR